MLKKVFGGPWILEQLLVFRLRTLKVTLLDGAYHDVDSSVLAFEIAARSAFREAMPSAGPSLGRLCGLRS